MKKVVLAAMLLLLSLCWASAEDLDLGLPLNPKGFASPSESNEITMGTTPSGFKYETYQEGEFSPWLKKLRRAEVIFFGGLPLSFGAVGLTYSAFGRSGEFWPMLGISAGVAALISLADFIIGEARDR